MAIDNSTCQDTLHSHIQLLPLELQDTILNFTLATPFNQTIHINASYTPPLALKINRSYRNLAAQTYYTANIFESSNPIPWLKSLHSSHTLKIQEIRIPLFDSIELKLRSRSNSDTPRMMLRPLLHHALHDLKIRIQDAGIRLTNPGVVLKIDWKAPGSEDVKVWFDLKDFATRKDPRTGWYEAGWDGRVEAREETSKKEYVDFRLKFEREGDRCL